MTGVAEEPALGLASFLRDNREVAGVAASEAGLRKEPRMTVQATREVMEEGNISLRQLQNMAAVMNSRGHGGIFAVIPAIRAAIKADEGGYFNQELVQVGSGPKGSGEKCDANFFCICAFESVANDLSILLKHDEFLERDLRGPDRTM